MGPWLTVADVAELDDCSPRTVQRWIDQGALRARRQPGGRLRIHRDWYDEMTLAGETGTMFSGNASGPARLTPPGPGTEGELHA